MSTDTLLAIVEPLLTWYRQNARILPWREEPTPYRVWISEIMLQQTRVEAVKPYFARFLEALPTVPVPAPAPERVQSAVPLENGQSRALQPLHGSVAT